MGVVENSVLVRVLGRELRTLNERVTGTACEASRFTLLKMENTELLVKLKSAASQCETLSKTQNASFLFLQNLRDKIDSLSSEVMATRSERTMLISQVIPHVVDQLLKSDEFGIAAASVVEAANSWEIALEEAAAWGTAVDLSFYCGYDPEALLKYDNASISFNETTYPYIQLLSSRHGASVAELLALVPEKFPRPSLSFRFLNNIRDLS